jgi:hypothetical protein
LWVIHTHLISYFQITPRLVVHSPVKRCGKTTLLDVLGCLVLRPLLASIWRRSSSNRREAPAVC